MTTDKTIDIRPVEKNQRVVSVADYRLIQNRKAEIVKKIPRRRDWLLEFLIKWSTRLDRLIFAIQEDRYMREYNKISEELTRKSNG